MIALNLQDTLAARLKALFSDYALLTKEGTQKAVKVFTQYLPQPKGPRIKPRGEEITEPGDSLYGPEDFEENFPCVVVKLDEGTDKEENTPDATRIVVHILVGGYDDNPDCQGYRDVMNIMETIRQDLLAARYLNHRYKLEMPFTWYLLEDQPWPVFFGYVETVWETGRPVASTL